MRVIKAGGPKWATHDKAAIDMMVEFEGLGEIPFTASPSDNTEHGPDLFKRANAGEFGEIAPYDGPTPEQEQAEAFQQQKRKAMAAIEAQIAPLERAKRLGVATPSELDELANLELYSVYLMRAEGPELIALSDNWGA